MKKIAQGDGGKRILDLPIVPDYTLNMRQSPLIKIMPLLIAIFLTLCTASLAGQFNVIRVYDGDTIMAQGQDITLYVLLAGIDAPEIDLQKKHPQQPYGQDAKRYLENLVLNTTVKIKGYSIGPYPYNHLIGEVYVNEKNINIEMVKKGFAEVYHETPPKGLNIAPYLEAEKEARAAKRGMWSSGDKYISPREWRKTHKRK